MCCQLSRTRWGKIVLIGRKSKFSTCAWTKRKNKSLFLPFKFFIFLSVTDNESRASCLWIPEIHFNGRVCVCLSVNTCLTVFHVRWKKNTKKKKKKKSLVKKCVWRTNRWMLLAPLLLLLLPLFSSPPHLPHPLRHHLIFLSFNLSLSLSHTPSLPPSIPLFHRRAQPH